MQVKKFEAPTLQEAIETIKREMGPEAIILQTKQNRRGFGLMSKGSVEVTAAVSERATEKKNLAERKLPEAYAQKIASSPAGKQADFYESYLEKKIERDKVQLSGGNAGRRPITAVRYADIIDDDQGPAPVSVQVKTNEPVALPQMVTPNHVGNAIEQYSAIKDTSMEAIQEELANLKRLVEDLRRERKRPEYLESDSPLTATDALQEGYELLLQNGVDRRLAVPMMRDIARELPVDARADHDSVLDAIAERLLRAVSTVPFFTKGNPGERQIEVFVGAAGTGKTALIAKLATHACRERQEKLGMIRIQLTAEEGMDPLIVFSKALHVPYRAVASVEELQVALQDMGQCSRIFIDTPGIALRDTTMIRALENVLKGVSRSRVHQVISAITRDQDAREQVKAYSVLKPGSLMFTRLDETSSFGNIYSLSGRAGLPVSVFSTGRKVTEQWENASAERLTASILNIL
jgi:flagellar biosynthesis protein FlhF